jgi:hypothetical protein
LASLTIAGPVVFYLTGGDRAKTQLGVSLHAKGIPPLAEGQALTGVKG